MSTKSDTSYGPFETLHAKRDGAIVWVTFDYPPVNVQGIPMIGDLDSLCARLEMDTVAKVVVFQSANPTIFVCHADTNFLKDMSSAAVPRADTPLLTLQSTLQRVSALPQATICKVEGHARGGGHEFMLACDMRFAARGRAHFMQMEVGMGILPCGGGASRMARQVGLGRALEVVLRADDFDADEAERIGTINRALDPAEIAEYVDTLARRIALWPKESITACKRTVYASVDLSIEEALKEEAYQLYQCTSSTNALQRFKGADEAGAQFSLDNQEKWPELLVGLQDPPAADDAADAKMK